MDGQIDQQSLRQLCEFIVVRWTFAADMKTTLKNKERS